MPCCQDILIVKCWKIHFQILKTNQYFVRITSQKAFPTHSPMNKLIKDNGGQSKKYTVAQEWCTDFNTNCTVFCFSVCFCCWLKVENSCLHSQTTGIHHQLIPLGDTDIMVLSLHQEAKLPNSQFIFMKVCKTQMKNATWLPTRSKQPAGCHLASFFNPWFKNYF